ncbi:MAG: hypothetical protein PGN34_11105 [Methylobacterium frigidaeris]
MFENPEKAQQQRRQTREFNSIELFSMPPETGSGKMQPRDYAEFSVPTTSERLQG